MKNKVSLIIPSKINKFYLEDFLISILFWSTKPDEIIIINTFKKKIYLDNLLKQKFKKNKIVVKILNKENLYPGAARNVGIKMSKYKILCFLDVNTVVYNKDWLKINLKLLNSNKIDGILGNTLYLSTNNKEKIIIASSYGFKYLQTLPGTIIKKRVFYKLGFFNKYTRAGEDTEWLLRAKNSKFKFKKIKQAVFYKGLYDANYFDIVKKWFRNYYSSSFYKHILTQKIIYISVFLIANVLLLHSIYSYTYGKIIINNFNLTYFLNNFFYLSVISYLIFRGLYLPIIKNTKIKFLFPINFLKITLFSILLDLIKTTSFFTSSLMVKKKIRSKIMKIK